MFQQGNHLLRQRSCIWLLTFSVIVFCSPTCQRSLAEEPRPRAILKGPEGQVSSAALAADQRVLAALNYRGAQELSEINLWDIDKGQRLRSFRTTKHCVRMAASRDGKRLATHEGVDIHLWNPATGKEVTTLKGREGLTGFQARAFSAVQALAFSPDGKTLAAGEFNGWITLWDVPAGSRKQTLKEHRNSIFCLTFAPDGKALASGGKDGVVRLWGVETGQIRKKFEGHKLPIQCVAISPDGKLMVSGAEGARFDEPGELKLWDIVSGKLITDFKGYRTGIASATFSPDGKTLVSGGGDVTGGEIKLWDVAGRKEIRSFKGHGSSVSSLAFSSDGKTLVTASVDWSIKVWDVAQLLSKQSGK